MAKLRSVSTAFWSDPFIEDLTPNEKLLFLYLVTNEKTNMLGIYESSIKKISFETGLTKSEVSNALKGFEKVSKVKYVNNFVILVNFMKHQNFNTNMKKSAIDIYNNLPNELKDSNLSISKLNPSEGFRTLLNHFGMVRKVEVELEIESEVELEEIKKPVFNFRKELINLGGNEQFINDWLKARKKKKASDTKTAFNGFKKQLVISGLDINTVLELCAVHSWITFKAEYAEGKVLNTNLDTDISESKLLTRWKDARKHYDKQETSIKQLTEDERKNFNKLLSDYKLKDFEQAIAGLFQQETFKTTRLRPTHFLQREHFEKYLTCFHTKEKLFIKKANNTIQRI